MSKTHNSKQYILALAAIAAISGGAVHAASGTWTGSSDANWSTAGNWSAVPGSAVSGTVNNADTATFNSNPANGTSTPIVIDTYRNLESISFDTAAGNFVIGSTGGTSIELTNGGTTQILATLTSTGVTETINAPLVLEPSSGTAAGSYTFANNAADPTSTLVFGGAISAGATTNTETLTLNGTNAGNNTITGNISNGGATTFAITKTGAGTWTLDDTISTNGTITVNGGTLNLAGAVTGASPISIITGGIVNMSGTDTGSGAVTLTSGALNVAGNAGNSGGNLLGTGAITIYNNTLSASSSAAGTFGLGTGAVALDSVLSLSASAGNAVNYTATDVTANSTKLTFGLIGGNIDTLALDANGGTVSFTLGNSGNTSGLALTRGTGGVLIITPSAVANLGASEQFFVTGQAATTGTIYGPYVMVVDTPANNSVADFVTYNADGFQAASLAGVEVNQSATSLDTENSSTVVFNVDQALSGPLTASRQVYALRTDFSIDPGANSLTIGNATTGASAGLILNGDNISIGSVANTGSLIFGTATAPGDGIIYTAQTATINTNITAKGGLTFAGVGALTINGNIALGTSTSYWNNPGDLEINGQLSSTSAAASIHYVGAGNLDLTADNSAFTGTFTVGPDSITGTAPLGTLTINNNTALGAGSIQFYMGSATAHTTLNITNDVTLINPTFVGGINGGYAAFSGTGNLTLNGVLTSNTNNTLENDLPAGKAIIYAGGINVTSSGNTLTFVGAGENIVSGAITGAGPIDYAGTGTGDITLDNANTFTGGFTIGGFTFSGDATVTLGDPAGFGTGTLSIFSATSATGPFITLQTASDMSIANNVLLGTAASLSRRFSVFGGTHSMNFTGNITLNSNNITVINNVASPASLTFSGPSFVLNAPDGNAYTFTITGTGDTVISAPISGNPAPFAYSSTGTLTLSGANTFNGPLDIYAGTVSVATINSVAGGSASSNLGAPSTVANGTIAVGSGPSSATLLYTGAGETTDRVINLAGTTGGATIDQSGTGLLNFTSALGATGGGSKTLTLQGSTAGTGEIAGIIKDNSTTNKTSLLKAGTGTWTLSAANTYTGGTTITGGTLVAGAAKALGSGNVTVTGGTLEIDPPVNIGAGNFSLTSGTLKLDLAADPTNALAGTGTSTYTLGDSTTVDLGIGAAAFDYTSIYDILTFHSGTVGDIAITDYDTADWSASIIDNGSGTAVLSFTVAAVPEPASLALLGLAGLPLVLRRRRNSRRNG